eukprot:TRINITY_DN2338_c0_g1_i1.p3 TRINITY_DN2338_c0_g1~~TRINITY_DN2338_c0_g1_i1.p3  ORF type:complete len:118 (-),score=7.71 TRINITY_DN2338_c0_g1_i1:179-532(-)
MPPWPPPWRPSASGCTSDPSSEICVLATTSWIFKEIFPQPKNVEKRMSTNILTKRRKHSTTSLVMVPQVEFLKCQHPNDTSARQTVKINKGCKAKGILQILEVVKQITIMNDENQRN